nr:MAG TPA: hypothetical protein [Caudoviricetes sp.]
MCSPSRGLTQQQRLLSSQGSFLCDFHLFF